MYLKKYNLKNKYALVTGAGKGLGRACAIALAEAGATVIGLSRTQSDLDKLQKDLKKVKGKLIKVNCDVMDYENLKNKIKKIKKIDVLVNNAGTNIPEPFEKIQQKSMNLAAEKASKEAQNILLDAIKSITIHDAFSILKGDDNSATKYLKNNTSNLLYNKFNPIVKNAIKSVNVTNYWKELVGIYNTIPLTKPVNPNLEEYVTNKAIDGLFVLISQEETNIRNHPEYRVSDLLRRVFK